jgi:hypothetical protein
VRECAFVLGAFRGVLSPSRVSNATLRDSPASRAALMSPASLLNVAQTTSRATITAGIELIDALAHPLRSATDPLSFVGELQRTYCDVHITRHLCPASSPGTLERGRYKVDCAGAI